jgi:hypothetical protein
VFWNVETQNSYAGVSPTGRIHAVYSSPMKMEQSVSKRPHINFIRRGITQKKEYNIQNMVKVRNQEVESCIQGHNKFTKKKKDKDIGH